MHEAKIIANFLLLQLNSNNEVFVFSFYKKILSALVSTTNKFFFILNDRKFFKIVFL